jgi:hypothetical protein
MVEALIFPRNSSLLIICAGPYVSPPMSMCLFFLIHFVETLEDGPLLIFGWLDGWLIFGCSEHSIMHAMIIVYPANEHGMHDGMFVAHLSQ